MKGIFCMKLLIFCLSLIWNVKGLFEFLVILDFFCDFIFKMLFFELVVLLVLMFLVYVYELVKLDLVFVLIKSYFWEFILVEYIKVLRFGYFIKKIYLFVNVDNFKICVVRVLQEY